MHGPHDLTRNDDKSLKGESLVLFPCILFVCFFLFGMRRIITKTDVHSIRDGPLEKLWGEGNFFFVIKFLV